MTTGAIDKGSDGVVGEEDELTLTVEIANSGNTCLTDVRVSDARNSPMVCKPAYTGEPICWVSEVHHQYLPSESPHLGSSMPLSKKRIRRKRKAQPDVCEN